MEKGILKPICCSCGERVLFEVQQKWNKKLNRYELMECGSEMCIGCLEFATADWTEFKDETPPFGMPEAADYEPTTADEYNDKWVNEQRRRGNITGDAK